VAEMLPSQAVRIGRTTIMLRVQTDREKLEPETKPVPGFISESEAIKKITALINRVARTQATVLLLGETGTGKEVAARGLHHLSDRGAGPFIPLNCGAIPKDLIESELFGHVRGAFSGAHRDRKGLFALASGGTILLDEIGEMPLAAQVRLLRFLDDHRVRPLGSEQEIHCDVRVLAATNQDIQRLVDEKIFRKELFFRLNMIRIHLPPLKDRGEDIDILAHHFLAREAASLERRSPGFTKAAIRRLHAYDWPGNIRELKSCIDGALILAPPDRPIDAGDLDIKADRKSRPETLNEVEKEAIRRALQTERTREAAARRLGIAASTLYEKIKKYNLK